jgi:nitroimidazol reductase NimA-like FMN-containing flavoprotein (pyridoxamine 5'-phosphate oxidase superfamily)
MTTVGGIWSREETEAFLDSALVPIRIGCHDTRGGLWMVSLWYRYADGQFHCATGSSSDLAAFLRANEQVSFEVSTNRPPYMGVRGNGTARLEPDEDKETLRSLFDRYLGGTESALADMLLVGDRSELTVSIEPDRLYTWDFTDRMGGTEASPAQVAETTSPQYDPTEQDSS